MKRYVFDSRGYFTGQVLGLTKYDTYPFNSTTIAPPSELARWDNTQWNSVDEIPPEPVKIPSEMGLKAFKLALHDADLLDTVTAHVSGLPVNVRKRVQIELDNGGDITLQQAKNLLGGVINDNIIEQIFINGG